eukprot:63575_1
MAQEVQTEGGMDDLESWLKKIGIKEKYAKKYVDQLEEEGIDEPTDLIHIETQNKFEELMNRLDGLRFLDREKIAKGWKALLPQGSQNQTPHQHDSIPMDATERASLEALGNCAKEVKQKMLSLETAMDGDKWMTLKCNEIRQKTEHLKQLLDERCNALIKELQNEFKQNKNEFTEEYNKWKAIALKLHQTKKKCDEALNISDFEQLQQRRSIIVTGVNETKAVVENALREPSAMDMNKIVVDLDDFNQIEDELKSIGRVYTQKFEININSLAFEAQESVLSWELSNKSQSELFDAVVSSFKVEIGVVIDSDSDDEKQMKNDEPGTSADKKGNVKWINQTVINQMNANKTKIKIKDVSDQLRDGNVICVKINVLNNKNQIIQQTQNKYFKICVSDSVQFVGYVSWKQVNTMSKEEEDSAMAGACASKCNGSRPATYEELFDKKINGLQKPSDTGHDVLLHSGNDDLWKGSAYSNGNRRFYRKGWNLSSYPDPASWNKDNATTYSNGTRHVIAVTKSLTAK